MKKTILLSLLGISLCAGASYGVYEYAVGGRCNPKGTAMLAKIVSTVNIVQNREELVVFVNKNYTMSNFIKIILSVFLFLCLAKMPYGYYAFVRFISMVGFAVLAYSAYNKGNNNEVLIYIALAVLFQPLQKIALGRVLWNIVDVIVAIWLLYSVFKKK